ncbi:MAG: hypothetical protein HLUCCA11_05175 [Phormidesmis priestleyi Ana]|uniref:Uncharacterized protein n=1 Tax=Phormidesmis priestleyi Ana TaxID=1666911 RepID=A0A0P8BRD5_9CYAN|nr:MAG: hypothetical protein HLUCCA11_05175 [Phormidesmis priestleyi Ana]
MIDDQGIALFDDCEGFLTELSAADEAFLAGGSKKRKKSSSSKSRFKKFKKSSSSKSRFKKFKSVRFLYHC